MSQNVSWEDDEKLRKELIEEISANFVLPARPGDMTADDFAAARGLTLATARYRLGKMVERGELVAVRVDLPGRPRPVTVYRRP